MKIIEGLKKLRIIEKRMRSNIQSITEYASSSSGYKAIFGTDDEQKRQVRSLIHSNTDLMKKYLRLKQRIEQTNLEIKVKIEGDEYTISELLVLKRKLADVMVETYSALNDEKGERAMKVENMSGRDKDGKSPHIVRYYDEKEKNAGVRKYRDLYDAIDSKIEIVNATTDLVGKDEDDVVLGSPTDTKSGPAK